jgi:hypothetical protein
MLEVTEKYEMAFDLLQEEDGPLMTYLKQRIGGKKGLGPPIEGDWDNIHHFVKFLKVFMMWPLKFQEHLG